MGTRHTFITKPLFVGTEDDVIIKALDEKIAEGNTPREIFKQEILWHGHVQIVYYHGLNKNLGGIDYDVGMHFFDTVVCATLSDEGDYHIFE